MSQVRHKNDHDLSGDEFLRFMVRKAEMEFPSPRPSPPALDRKSANPARGEGGLGWDASRVTCDGSASRLIDTALPKPSRTCVNNWQGSVLAIDRVNCIGQLALRTVAPDVPLLDTSLAVCKLVRNAICMNS
jgi:hypothetical protein